MQSLLCLLSFYLSSYSLLTLFMFLSPLGERLGEGVPKTVSCITPSPSLSPKGERSMKGEEYEKERSMKGEEREEV